MEDGWMDVNLYIYTHAFHLEINVTVNTQAETFVSRQLGSVYFMIALPELRRGEQRRLELPANGIEMVITAN